MPTTIDVLDAAENIVSIEKPNANGQALMAASRPVAVASDQPQIPVKTTMVAPGVTFTRPADTTAYSANDVVGPAVAALLSFAGAFRLVAGSAYIVKAKLKTNQQANVAQFRLHLYNAAPTVVADNVQFPILFADEAKHLGFIDFPAMQTEGNLSDSAFALWTGQISALAAAADTTIYGVLETKTAFTPASGQQFAVRLSLDQN
jgi:hypothetical protein